MIKNDRAYKVTKAAADKFVRMLTEHEIRPTDEGKSEIARSAEASALRAQLADLREQVADYERLRAGGVEELETTRLEGLPALLIRARIAQQLTHEQLADLVDVKPQQIQRWEDDDYQSAAFWRLVDIADALGLSVNVRVQLPEPSVPDVEVVVDKLKRLGVDKTFVQQKLIPVSSETSDPKEAARVFGKRIEAILAQSLPDLLAANDSQVWARRSVANARFKVPANAKETPVAFFAAYAYFLASSLCAASGRGRSDTLPGDWSSMRSWLFAGGAPDLRTGVTRLWEAGIPVLPLASKGGPHGACWRIGGRGAIVLKQSVQTASRWLFDLVHELKHLVDAGDADEFGLLAAEGTSEGRRSSDEEVSAHTFAADVLLEGRAEALYQAVAQNACGQPSRMKGAIVHVAESEGVEVGLLAEHVAYRFCRETDGNIWGAAHKLQKETVEPFVIVRDALLAKLNLTTLPEPAGGLLRQALNCG